MGITWGPRPHLIRWIFTGIVRPALAYGNLVWAHSIQYLHQTKKLKRLHAIITRLLAPKRKSTPIAGMEMIAYLPPLDIYLKGEAIKSYVRNRLALPHDWDGLPSAKRKTTGHIKAVRQYLGTFQIPALVWDRRPHTFNFHPTYEVDESSYQKGEDVVIPNMWNCYTDGSKLSKDGQVGAGFVLTSNRSNTSQIPLITKSYHLQDYHTVFQAEMTAINKAAHEILAREDIPPQITILSDSKSSIMALRKYATPSKTLQTCMNVLNELGSKTKLVLRWIKAHVGHIGNEKADEAAKAGASQSHPDVVNLTTIPAPYSYLVSRVEKGICRLWTNRWQNEQNPDGTTRYRQSKIFFPQPDKGKSYFLIRQDKPTLFKLTQFITGHAFMRRHDNLVAGGAPDQATCRLCHQGDETPHHLVHECDAIWRTRMLIFGQDVFHYGTEGYTLKWNGGQLLSFLNHEKISGLFTNNEDPPSDAEDDDHADDPPPRRGRQLHPLE